MEWMLTSNEFDTVPRWIFIPLQKKAKNKWFTKISTQFPTDCCFQLNWKHMKYRNDIAEWLFDGSLRNISSFEA